MLHACVERFDVMCVKGNILGWEGEVNAAEDVMDACMILALFRWQKICMKSTVALSFVFDNYCPIVA
jgi:hypothetical protein